VTPAHGARLTASVVLAEALGRAGGVGFDLGVDPLPLGPVVFGEQSPRHPYSQIQHSPPGDRSSCFGHATR
jgi:hypothetical protein